MDHVGDNKPSPDDTRCADMWFEDGTVALKADTTLFRVFSGILAKHSSVFRDMFSLPQPQSVETYEGCPFVHLHDRAADLEYFLKALHDASFYAVEKMHEGVVVAGVLRLSIKYDVPFLRQRSIRLLSPSLPTTLSGYDARRALPKCTSSTSSVTFIEVVHLAREGNALILLPYALLWFSIGRLEYILDGSSMRHVPEQAELTWDDKRLCLLARQKLEKYARMKVFGFLLGKSESPACEWPAACNALRVEIISSFEHKFRNTCWNPLYKAFPLESRWQFCPACHASFESRYTNERQALWNDLPNIFGLGSWETLKEAE